LIFVECNEVSFFPSSSKCVGVQEAMGTVEQWSSGAVQAPPMQVIYICSATGRELQEYSLHTFQQFPFAFLAD